MPALPASGARPSRNALAAAARWYVQLHAEPESASDHQHWQTWLASSPEHRQAWQRVEALARQMQMVPADLAMPTLASAQVQRRAVLKSIAVLVGGGAAGLASWQAAPLPALMADHRTMTGERRQLQLADGSRLDLNTDTAVAVVYSGSERRLHLLRGEIMVQTAPDHALAGLSSRPFLVETAEGSIRALGTRFSVRQHEGQTAVVVHEHAVEIRPDAALGRRTRIEAGEQTRFSANGVDAAKPADMAADAWTRGTLVAIEWRLADFINELARYRAGHLACDPAVADVRISGAFRLDDTDAVLDNLAFSLPIRVRHFTRYWVRIEPV